MQIKIRLCLSVFAVILVPLLLFGCSHSHAITTANIPEVMAAQREPEEKAPEPADTHKPAETQNPKEIFEPTIANTPEPTLTERKAELFNSFFTRLINRGHLLPADYVPEELIYVRKNNPHNVKLKSSSIRANPVAWEAFNQMLTAAKEDGVTGFYLHSIYRSYSSQKSSYNKKVKADPTYGKDPNVPIIVAYPGGSEHQTGLAFDITAANATAMSRKFATTPQGKWLIAHSYEYGFILRYPDGKQNITKIVYETWHYRYVGVELATYLTKNGLTLEEFYEGM